MNDGSFEMGGASAHERGSAMTEAAATRMEIPILDNLEEWAYFTNEVHQKTALHEVTLCAMFFMLGDLWNQGVATYGEEQCLQIAANQDWSSSRMMNVARVSRQVSQNRRRHHLTFKHHEEVAVLDHKDQIKMLTKAEDEELSANELRRKIRGKHSIDSANSSETNEHGTPSRYVELARSVLGRIDVDPASNHIFNKRVVKADYFLGADHDGLSHEWNGRVWVNPPYGKLDDGGSRVNLWVQKLLEEFKAGRTTEAIILVNAFTSEKWFAPLWAFPICFCNHRIRFETVDGDPGEQPRHSSAFVYLGEDRQSFVDIFTDIGPVLTVMEPS